MCQAVFGLSFSPLAIPFTFSTILVHHPNLVLSQWMTEYKIQECFCETLCLSNIKKWYKHFNIFVSTTSLYYVVMYIIKIKNWLTNRPLYISKLINIFHNIFLLMFLLFQNGKISLHTEKYVPDFDKETVNNLTPCKSTFK